MIRRQDTWRGGLAGLVLVLLRVEGLAWAILVGFCAYLSNWLSGVRTRRVPLTYFTIVIAGFAIFLAWRYSYYESLIANTAHAKNIGLSFDGIERGIRYVAVYVVTFLTPLLILPAGIIAFDKTLRPIGVPTLILTVAPIGYSIAVGGDYMTMGRFLVPMLPFTVLLFGWLLKWLWERNQSMKDAVLVGGTVTVVIALSLLPAANVHVVPEQIRMRIDWKTPPYLSELTKWNVGRRHSIQMREMALALNDFTEPEDTLVTHAVGNLGYYSHLFVYDRSGLLNREVAARPVTQLIAPGHDKLVPPEFFLKERPTILEAELVPVLAFDRAIERFENRCEYLQETFGVHYCTGRPASENDRIPWSSKSHGGELALSLNGVRVRQARCPRLCTRRSSKTAADSSFNCEPRSGSTPCQSARHGPCAGHGSICFCDQEWRGRRIVRVSGLGSAGQRWDRGETITCASPVQFSNA